ncbi:M48 family metallopeptidase [Carboxylicivirga sp. RSCT41]|uniref:M48 family metallopeptidase n=1 Tax=Carboxylicivirga agarovorans TaxID=3417570 RepID=UPI003D3582D1
MKNEQIIDIPQLGKVTIRQSAKASRISIRLKPFNGVSLIIPQHGDLKDGIRFLHEKREWIQKNLRKLEEKEQKLTIFDEQTRFQTRSFALRISKHTNPKVRLLLKDGILQVYYPSNMPVSSPEIQETIRYGIEEALRMEAKRFLPGRLAWLAKEHNIRYQNVTIKNLKSRWGSCSATNNINLNLHLMRLPAELIDYVLLHELCHVHEKNHGPHFWARLDIMCNGKARQLDKAMKDYQTKIY